MQNQNTSKVEFFKGVILDRILKCNLNYSFRRVFSFLLYSIILTNLSCESTDSPKGLNIKNSQISVDFKDSTFIGASSDYEISYYVQDPFIVSIEGDKLIGRHVGSTTITASSNGETKDIKVTVLSISNMLQHPIEDYANGKEFYRDKYEHFSLEYQDDSTLIYFILNYDALYAYYLQLDFTKENTTKNAVLLFRIGTSVKLYYAILEHYELFEKSDTTVSFNNALDPLMASERLILILDKGNQLCYIFITKIEPTLNFANKNAPIKFIKPQNDSVIKSIQQKVMNKNLKMIRRIKSIPAYN